MRVLIFSIAMLLALAFVAACDDGGSAPRKSANADTAVMPQPTAPAPPHTLTPDGRITVVLDPGHGGDEVGAVRHGVVEKESNLDMALRVDRLLLAEGYRVVLTRREDERVAAAPGGASSNFGATRFDLQARIDIANEAEGDVFVAIHSNGSETPSQSGAEVWYDPQRAFGEDNRALAELLQSNVLDALAAYGYTATDRGLRDDSCFRQRNGRCFPLFVLGPERIVRRADLIARGLSPESFGFAPEQEALRSRATRMPGALAELLFITNAQDAAVLADDAGREAIARGVAAGLRAFMEGRSGG